MPSEKVIIRPSKTYEGSFSLCRPCGAFLAWISPEDVISVARFRWHTSRRYVARTYKDEMREQSMELLQRHVAANMGLPIVDAEVRFDNRNSRDCRRGNLILVPRRPRKRLRFGIPEGQQP